MIVLDTNQLEHAQPPNGPTLTMLRTIAQETNHELGLPEMALIEHLAHFRHETEVAHQKLRGAVRDLQRLAPFWPGQVTAPFDVDAAVRHRTQQVGGVMRILKTPQQAPLHALDREASRQLPAKTSWDCPGAGARDVAVWLTALDACREAQSATYFVSQDKDAFGEKQLHPELSADVLAVLGDGADQFHYCYGIDALLDELADKQEHRLNRDKIAAAEPVREAVRIALAGPDVYFELLNSAARFAGHQFSASSPEIHDLNLLSARQITAYQTGNTTWATARSKWSGRKDFTVHPSTGPTDLRPGVLVQIRFTVTTTLVMQLDPAGDVVSAEVSGRSRYTDIEGNATP
jgi:hypothetical protein